VPSAEDVKKVVHDTIDHIERAISESDRIYDLYDDPFPEAHLPHTHASLWSSMNSAIHTALSDGANKLIAIEMQERGGTWPKWDFNVEYMLHYGALAFAWSMWVSECKSRKADEKDMNLRYCVNGEVYRKNCTHGHNKNIVNLLQLGCLAESLVKPMMEERGTKLVRQHEDFIPCADFLDIIEAYIHFRNEKRDKQDEEV